MRLKRLVILGLLTLVAIGLGGWWLLTPAPTLAEGPRTVEIPPHLGVREVAERLAESELIRSRLAFVALATVSGSARRLKAGEYEIPKDASPLTILALLASGRVVQHPVLLPEGGTVAELARILESGRLASEAEVLGVARDPAVIARLGIQAPSLEGYLFPDTYHVVRGMTVEEMLTRMVQRLRTKLTPEIVAQAEARGLTIHQLLTLASIIEREAVVPDEMPLISAVFWNRLKRDMPLQADPTVQYAVGKERRALTRADLQVEDPFNTYRRPGLPPGPIASPGLAAIDATLRPAAVNYLYFVAMDDRRHVFSSTVEAHNAAVARYRLARDR
jgi:UPF0755 protein